MRRSRGRSTNAGSYFSILNLSCKIPNIIKIARLVNSNNSFKTKLVFLRFWSYRLVYSVLFKYTHTHTSPTRLVTGVMLNTAYKFYRYFYMLGVYKKHQIGKKMRINKPNRHLKWRCTSRISKSAIAHVFARISIILRCKIVYSYSNECRAVGYNLLRRFPKPEVALRETGCGVWTGSGVGTGSGLIKCEFDKNNLIRIKNSSDLIISKLPSYFS